MLLIDDDGTVQLDGVRFQQDSALQVRLQELASRTPQPPITVGVSLKAGSQRVTAVTILLQKDGLMYGIAGEEQYGK